MSIDVATLLYFLSIPVMIAVTIVLIVGLVSMARRADPKTQNKLMAWRVGLQAIAVALMVGAVFMLGAR